MFSLSEFHGQFDKQAKSLLHGFRYDYGSIMHYNAYAFAIDKSVPTIEALRETTDEMGQRDHPSEFDIGEIKNLYSCGGG